jgi:hypothetical protein
MSIPAMAIAIALQMMPQQWVFAGGDANTGFAVEKSTLRRSGSTVTTWVQAIPKAPMANMHIGMADYVLSRSTYDCDQQTIQRSTIIVYRTDGTVANNATYPNPEIETPPPGSVGLGILNFLCTPGEVDEYDAFDTPQAMRDAYRAQVGS